LSPMSSEPENSTGEQKIFAVALSFSGRHRAYVRIVANALKIRLNENLKPGEPEREVLYDKDYWGKLAGRDVHLRLPDWYEKEAQLVVAFISDDYSSKHWCRLEWEKIKKEYIENLAHQNRLMPLFIGDRFERERDGPIKDLFEDTFEALGIPLKTWGSFCIHEAKGLEEVVEQISKRYEDLLRQDNAQKLALQQTERERDKRVHDEFIEELKLAGLVPDVIDIILTHVRRLTRPTEEAKIDDLTGVLGTYNRYFGMYRSCARQNRTIVARTASPVIGDAFDRFRESLLPENDQVAVQAQSGFSGEARQDIQEAERLKAKAGRNNFQPSQPLGADAARVGSSLSQYGMISQIVRVTFGSSGL
jgi:TIR domain-containing protein